MAPKTVQDDGKSFRACVVTVYDVDWEKLKGHLRYLAYGAEVCPNTGRKHWQCFAYAWKKQRFSAFMKMFPKNHIKKMGGNFRENEVYCSKESHYTHFGVKPNEDGIKMTVLEVKRRLDNGENHMTVAEDPECFNTVRQSSRFFQEYAQHVRFKKARVDRTRPKVYKVR